MSKVELNKRDNTETQQLYHSDGGLDLVLGTVLVNLGFDVLNGAASASLFSYIPIFILYSMKSRFTVTRLGLDRLGIDERTSNYWARQLTLWTAIGLIFLSIMTLGDPLSLQEKLNLPWAGDIGCLMFAVIGGVSLFLTAWKTTLKRFKIYAAVAFASGLISYFILPLYAPMFITAAVMVVPGVKLMMEFSRQYPEPEKDKEEESK